MTSSKKKVTVDYVLGKFVEILDSEASWSVKVRALELLGKYLNMFVDQKKVNIDVRQLVTGVAMEDLKRLAGEDHEVGDSGKESGSRRERYLGMHSPIRDGSELGEAGDGDSPEQSD